MALLAALVGDEGAVAELVVGCGHGAGLGVGDGAVEAEYRWHHPNGSLRWLLIRGKTQFGEIAQLVEHRQDVAGGDHEAGM